MAGDDELVWQLHEEREVSIKHFHTESWVHMANGG